MGSRSSESESGRRWQLVLEPGGEAARVFVVRNATDADEVMGAVREGVRSMMARGGCRSMTIAVHVEGPSCDHELGGG